jgi:acyl dehydratase
MITMRVLSKTPRTLPLYARAAAAAIPGASLLPFLPGDEGEVPDVRLRLDGVRSDPGRLALYSSVCGFPASEHLPVTYPHILAFPLHMTLLTDGHFPFGPIGLVHIENRILQHRAIPLGEQLDLRVRVTSAAPHPRGSSFALISDVRIAGETVWESTSTMLHRAPHPNGKQHRAPRPEGDTQDVESGENAVRRETWTLPRDLGRRYAAVSADRNPIHTHPLAARLLGFPGAIVHGMWTIARTVAALGGELPDRHGIEGAFRKPIVVGATVQLSSRTGDGETEFAVHDAERHVPHLRGRLWALEPHHDATTTTRRGP